MDGIFSGVPLKRPPFPLLECWVGRTRRIKQRGREEVDPSKFVDPNPCHSTMEYHNVAGRGGDRGSGGGVTTVFLFPKKKVFFRRRRLNRSSSFFYAIDKKVQVARVKKIK